MDFIPQIEPWLDNSELIQLSRVIKNGYVTEHDLTKEFESLLKKLTGAKYVIAITNGTAALFCGLKALNIGINDEVIVPNITFIASSNAVIMSGAIPVLCEIDNTGCIDVKKIEKLITKKTKAIMPVHLYGQSCDIKSIIKLAKKYNLKVIEDAAQGVGVRFDSQHVGTFGDVGILSFYGNKTITCGEGGVILTNSKKLRNKIYQLKNHGRLKKGTFKHKAIGYNFCFTEMQAAIGISQINKLPLIIKRKKDIRSIYNERLGTILKSLHINSQCSPVWWFTSFLSEHKKQLKQYLLKKNIQTRDFFYPLHKQPCYKYLNNNNDEFKLSESTFSKGISLPSSYSLTDCQQSYIINNIIKFYKKK